MVKRILVVDDDHHIVEFLQEELSKKLDNVTVLAADGGYEALRYIMSGETDLLITDIAMPDMDGYQLFLRAKEYDSNLPVIMITGFGYDPNHTVVNARAEGLSPQNILFKPFDTDYLVDLVKELLDNNSG